MSDIKETINTFNSIITKDAILNCSDTNPLKIKELAVEIDRYRYYLFEMIDFVVNSRRDDDIPVFDIIDTANRLSFILEEISSRIKNECM